MQPLCPAGMVCRGEALAVKADMQEFSISLSPHVRRCSWTGIALLCKARRETSRLEPVCFSRVIGGRIVRVWGSVGSAFSGGGEAPSIYNSRGLTEPEVVR